MPAPKTKRNLKPQTPGQEVSPDQLPPQEDDLEEEAEVVEQAPQAEVAEEAEEETVTVTSSQLEDIVNRMVDQRMTDAAVMQRRAGLKTHNPAKELPGQEEIDPTQLKRAVLSKDGWVCPIIQHSDRIRMQQKQIS